MATFQLAVNGSQPGGLPKDAPSTVSAREHLRKGVPDIYRRDYNARSDQPPPFAIRFLHALEEVLDPIVATLDSLPAHLDVDLAPEHALAGLATWLGVDDVEALPAKQRREAVRRAGELARLRGTRAGLELALSLFFPDVVMRVNDHGGVVVSESVELDGAGRGDRLLRRRLRPVAAARDADGRRTLHRELEARPRALQAARAQGPAGQDDARRADRADGRHHAARAAPAVRGPARSAPPAQRRRSVSEGVVCRSCGKQNEPGRDFCEQCGEYLAWAPTSMMPAVPGATGAGDDRTSSEGEGEDAPRSATSGAGMGEPPPPSEGEGGPGLRGVSGAPGVAAARDAAEASDAADTQARAAADAAAAGGAGSSPGVAPQTVGTGEVPAAPQLAQPPAAQVMDAPPPPPPPPPGASFPEQLVGIPESPPPTGDASLVLAPIDPVIGAAGVPAVDAGSMLTFRATVRNESQIVDNYDLAVLGLPENWAVVTPGAAFLVPLGSGRGDSELELRIDIAPPRDYRSTAGIWTFELVALSRTGGTLAARAIAHFEVLPFQAWSIEVVPAINSGRFKARYRTAVRNDGNAEQMLWPAAMDDSGKLRRRFEAGKLTLEAGEVGADTLIVRPRIPKIVGRATEHRIGVDVVATEPVVEEVQSGGGLAGAREKAKAKAKQQAKQAAAPLKTGRPPRMPVFNPMQKLRQKLRPDPALLSKLRGGTTPGAPITGTQVVYRQKPVIPLWLIGLMLLLALAAVLIYLLWPQKTNVPSLVGASDAFAAEKQLREKDLKLSQPVERRVDPDAEPGSVIEQTPSAGTKVDKDSTVSIVVADGATKVEVPRLKGQTRVAADKRLRDDGLELGETQPADAPDNYVVRSQIPDAGLEVDRGTAVRVFLRKPPPTAKEKAAAKKEAAAEAKADAEKADDVRSRTSRTSRSTSTRPTSRSSSSSRTSSCASRRRTPARSCTSRRRLARRRRKATS